MLPVQQTELSFKMKQLQYVYGNKQSRMFYFYFIVFYAISQNKTKKINCNYFGDTQQVKKKPSVQGPQPEFLPVVGVLPSSPKL